MAAPPRKSGAPTPGPMPLPPKNEMRQFSLNQCSRPTPAEARAGLVAAAIVGRDDLGVLAHQHERVDQDLDRADALHERDGGSRGPAEREDVVVGVGREEHRNVERERGVLGQPDAVGGAQLEVAERGARRGRGGVAEVVAVAEERDRQREAEFQALPHREARHEIGAEKVLDRRRDLLAAAVDDHHRVPRVVHVQRDVRPEDAPPVRSLGLEDAVLGSRRGEALPAEALGLCAAREHPDRERRDEDRAEALSSHEAEGRRI